VKEIWPLFGLFSFFRIWPFMKLIMAKFGLFNFFEPGNPGKKGRDIKRRGRVTKSQRHKKM